MSVDDEVKDSLADDLLKPTSSFAHSMLAFFWVPVLTLLVSVLTIRHDPEPPYLRGNFSPYGYTISLLIFLAPTVTLGMWFFTHCRVNFPREWRACWIAFAIVVPLWCAVDVILGNTFFRFPNPGATLQIFAPGYQPGHGWPRSIPIEEFVFYASGCAVILLGYLWTSKVWFNSSMMPPGMYRARAEAISKLIVVRPRAAAVGLLLFGAALAWKKFGPHEYHAGFPGYFLFEIVLVVGPATVLYEAVRPFINRPAFLVKTLTLVLLSLMWEATMALPYGWWGYHQEQMMGIVVKPWFDLPVEAVMLWPAAAFMNICLYEVIRLCLHSGRPWRDVLFGVPHSSTNG